MRCQGTAKCACDRVYPCPLPRGHNNDHPTRLDECYQCRDTTTRSHGRPRDRATTPEAPTT